MCVPSDLWSQDQCSAGPHVYHQKLIVSLSDCCDSLRSLLRVCGMGATRGLEKLEELLGSDQSPDGERLNYT